MAEDDYFKILAKRSKGSKVYREHQLFGLEIAALLEDEAHKGLYMKLGKTRDPARLLALAKEISGNKKIKNKGAYFMARLSSKKNGKHNRNDWK